MTTTPLRCLRWIPAVLCVLAFHTPAVSAPTADSGAQRLHANALASYRQGRFAEAYGRLMQLADAGHAPSAELALWMYRNGPTVFGSQWDVSPDQIEDWVQLVRQPVPALVSSVSRSNAIAPAAQTRR